MLDQELIKRFLKLNRRQIIVTLLLFTPVVLQILKISLPEQFVFINTYILSGGFLMIPMLFIYVSIFGIPFASPTDLPGWYLSAAALVALLATPLFWYVVVRAVISFWDNISAKLSGRIKLCLIVILIILFYPFVYENIILPGVISRGFSVEAITPPEISIDNDKKRFYDENGSFEKYVVRDYLIRNDSNFETTHEVPRSAFAMCLYNTQSGAIINYTGYFADENGHGFVSGPNWNKIVLAPKSEVRFYLLGDMELSDDFDEILLSDSIVWGVNKYDCSKLTKKEIAGAETIEILK
ncbi:MAG: hypothetical protein WCQ96_04365 [Patescibacteria group bacterium]